MSGECYLVLDDSEILVKAGDAVVRRGTNHSWSNRSGKPRRIAFIMIDGSYDRAIVRTTARLDGKVVIASSEPCSKA